MRILWAPWRMVYIREFSKASKKGCIFCNAVRGKDEEHYVVYRSKYSIAMLNLYPYNTAHVMVAPKRHVSRPNLLSDEELLDLYKVVNLVIEALDREYKPHGYNVGMNIGRIAGAGIEAHLHVHIVPRWSGDTNFMPVIANVKVMPEDLRETFRRVREAISSLPK